MTRFDKTQFLSEVPETKEWLSVCWRDIDNCSECPKCIRTLSTLELLGQIDEYNEIFDIAKYRRNHIWHWAKIISLSKNDYFYNEIYQEAVKRDKKFPLKTRLLASIFSAGRFLFPAKLLSALQRIAK